MAGCYLTWQYVLPFVFKAITGIRDTQDIHIEVSDALAESDKTLKEFSAGANDISKLHVQMTDITNNNIQKICSNLCDQNDSLTDFILNTLTKLAQQENTINILKTEISRHTKAIIRLDELIKKFTE